MAGFLAAGAILTLASGAGVYLVLNDMQSDLLHAREELASLENRHSIVVLSRDLAPGETITADDITTVDITASVLPDAIIRNIDELQAEIGAAPMALRALSTGHFLQRSDIGTPGEETLAGVVLPLGAQGYVFAPENPTKFVTDLNAGDRIDVYWRTGERDGAAATRAIATGLSFAGYVPAPKASGPATGVARPQIAVAAQPEDIARLIEASASGSLYIVPTNRALDLTARSITADASMLAAMPFLSVPGQRPSAQPARPAAPELPTAASDLPTSTGAEQRPPATPPAQAVPANFNKPEVCMLNVVRSAQRTVVEVPC